ncbi:MAG: hypothetical protein M0035_00825 [Actinomycetota bacterium]|nr:hypothetical protein [Actinomycetota bacterium]
MDVSGTRQRCFGKGSIGERGLARSVGDPFLAGLSAILEVPGAVHGQAGRGRG